MRSCAGSGGLTSMKDQKFAELGKYLCEVRNQGYWRLGYGSFEDFLGAKFSDSRRKAYYLMSIYDNLRQIPTEEIESLGWSKALELAKIARSEGQRFESATWLHKAKESSKEELQQEVHRYFTGEDLSPTRWSTSNSSRASCPSLKEHFMWPLAWRARSGPAAFAWS